MGLDVYVGSLTRYYLGNWETIVQQAGREQGLQVQVMRPSQPKRSLLTRFFDRFRGAGGSGPEAALRDVMRWRTTLGKISGVGESFEWNESPEYEYFTDKPAWDCYGALLLWACYQQLPKAKRASGIGEWSSDPAYQTIRSIPKHPYVHLLEDTEFWFPVDFPRPFSATNIHGQTVAIGSSVRLIQELESLNVATWGATDEVIDDWRAEGADYGAPLEKSARFGFAIFYELAKLSVQHRLPMKLDY